MQLNLQNAPIQIGNATVLHIDHKNLRVAIRVRCNCTQEESTNPEFLEENTSPYIKYVMGYLVAEGFLSCTGNYDVHIAVVTNPNE